MGFGAQGGELERLGELPAVSRAVLDGAPLEPVLTSTKPRGGCFLRAESIAIVVHAARAGAQFVVATHSPVLLACPDARIYELGDHGIASRPYDDLEAVRLTRALLDAPDRFLYAALDDDE